MREKWGERISTQVGNIFFPVGKKNLANLQILQGASHPHTHTYTCVRQMDSHSEGFFI
jgi:hypothetical protein